MRRGTRCARQRDGGCVSVTSCVYPIAKQTAFRAGINACRPLPVRRDAAARQLP
jgi:hypothetical protein